MYASSYGALDEPQNYQLRAVTKNQAKNGPEIYHIFSFSNNDPDNHSFVSITNIPPKVWTDHIKMLFGNGIITSAEGSGEED